MVKEYNHDEIKSMPSQDIEKSKVKEEIENLAGDLFRSCSAGFSEVYHALLHLKVFFYKEQYLRLFTESTLKFGSSDYHSCVVFTLPGKETKIVSQMIKTFSDTSNNQK